MLRTTLIASMIALAGGSVALAQSQSQFLGDRNPAPAGTQARVAPGTAFTYQGTLEDGGAPVTTAVDVRFTLYEDAAGTIQRGSPVTVPSITPDDGVFSTSVDFGTIVFDTAEPIAYWLRVEVSPAGAGTFDDLGLQALEGTPFALNVRGLHIGNGEHVGVGLAFNNVALNVRQKADGEFVLNAQNFDGSANYLTIPTGGNVGIGTTTPDAKLNIEDGSLWINGTDSQNLDPSTGAGLRMWMEDSLGDAVIQAIDYSTLVGRDLLLQPDGGNVGVATLTPGEKLSVNGRVESLNGGFKFPDGTVQTTAAFGSGTEYLCLGPGDFVANNSANPVRNDWFGGVYGTVGTNEILAPIHLPVGAAIQSITAYVHDTVAADLRIAIWSKVPGNTSTNGTGNDFIVTGNSGFFNQTHISSGAPTIAQGRAYYIEAFPTGGNWPGTRDLSIQTIVIEWTMP